MKPASGLRIVRSGRPLLALALAALAGCAHHHPRVSRRPAPPPVPAPAPAPTPPSKSATPLPGPYLEEGLASWYGVPYHGRRAASGEIYNMYELTAAHRTLPFKSLVRVTNLKNGRRIEVRINDRGPFIENRIVDLSLAAARELDMVAMGVASVRLEVLSGPSPVEGDFTVQVGAFRLRENAERLRQRLEPRYATVRIQEYNSPDGLFYRVRVGQLPTLDAARQLAEQLHTAEGFETFVVRVDD